MKKTESIYIHIPFCISKCGYCDFFSIPCSKGVITDDYINALCKEIKFKFQKYKVTHIKTIYIGGGTPSLLKPDQIKKISDAIKNCSILDENYEFTIELNPDDVSEELLKGFEENGITRISCGIQSLNDKCLKYAGRRASVLQNLAALETIKQNWKGQVSLDLICGLPEETEFSFCEGLNKIIRYNPDHISMYSLTIDENTPFGIAVDKNQLKIEDDFQDELWISGRKILQAAGYNQYEVSNFCKINKECKHNLVYWNHEGYIGAGSGACGTVYEDDGGGLRWTNKTDIKGYIDFWAKNNSLKQDFADYEIIDKKTSMFEFFMMGFRKLQGVTDTEFYNSFGEKISDEKLEVLKKWNKNGLLEIKSENNQTRYFLNQSGILLLNRLLEELI